jgi:sugar-specific transcriptional regulator TrmB
MDGLVEALAQAGLSDREAKVYVRLVRNSTVGGGALARELGMDRSHTYNLLSNLVKKGLASHVTRNGKQIFAPTPPENLLNSFATREQAVREAVTRLKTLGSISPKPPSVQVLEGKQGLRAAVRAILDSHERELLVFGGTGKSYEVLHFEIPHAAARTAQLRIKGRMITSERLRSHPMVRLPNFKIRFLPEATAASTTIFKDKVLIAVFEEAPFFILIENKTVAKSYRDYFEYLWKISTSK